MPVLDATKQAPYVDVIEMILRIGPLCLTVVDLKFEIWRHPLRLYGRQVCPDDRGAEILVGKIHGPDPRTGTDVEDVRYVGRNWSEAESAVKREGEEMVGEI